jgi:catechol 2,3-dioxygenase-like lactoylglutathione lyase family enzyme
MEKPNRLLNTILMCLVLSAGAEGQTMTTNPNMPSRVSIIAIGVTDLTKSIGFYNGTLGLPEAKRSEDVAFISTSTITIMLSGPLGRFIKPATGSTEIIFPVDSVSTAYRLLTERGCTFIKQPNMVIPETWAATFKDPDGHLLTILGGK